MVAELSILIPVFNYNITALIKELHQQCEANALQFEIRLYDDGSATEIRKQNEDISNLPKVCYQLLPKHLGRAVIRNKLAQDALYPYLLFLDNDSQIISKRFILNYLLASQKAPVLIGGTTYSIATPPVAYRLHWQYGKNREQKPAEARNLKPYQAFYLNNIFLAREVMLAFPLQELITDYGHEDSLFGLRLQQAKVKVLHLDNPVLHAGLEQTSIYLAKTCQAVINLYYLHQVHGLGAETKLIRTYLKLNRYGLTAVFRSVFARLESRILQQLQGPAPSLFLFDVYKLYLFALQHK